MERHFAAGDIRGLKFFKPVRALLERLHGESAHPNRELHFDEYVCLLLLYYFNPLVTSLRDIQAVSDLDAIAKRFGVRRASLGSLSEASQVFDPEPLRAIFQELAGEAQSCNAPQRPRGVPNELAILGVDGTLLDALPRMLWAIWLSKHQHAVKIHLEFDILRGVPADAELTAGSVDEKAVLRKKLKKNCLYVMDRGYVTMNYSRRWLRPRVRSLRVCAAMPTTTCWNRENYPRTHARQAWNSIRSCGWEVKNQAAGSNSPCG